MLVRAGVGPANRLPILRRLALPTRGPSTVENLRHRGTTGRRCGFATCPYIEALPAQAAMEVPSETNSNPDRDIFRCPGIEGAALTMRRRVQAGAALQIVGTQFSNYIGYHDWNHFIVAMETFHFENSAVLLAVSVFAIWQYHAFLRDALMARHVTRIAIAAPATPALASAIEEIDEIELPVCEVLIEAGPWTRRVELLRPRAASTTDKQIDMTGSQIPLGRLFQLGLLHIDYSRGHVIDEAAFESLMHDGLVLGKEVVYTDVAYANYAFVTQDSMLPFLSEAGVSGTSGDGKGSTVEELQKYEWINRTFQLNGGKVMTYFGNLALCMGVGAVAVWTVPWQQCLENLGLREQQMPLKQHAY